MADIRNCRRCGRIYNYIGGAPLCYDCKSEDEKNFQRVKDYLYKNPGATISEVSTELSISVERIKSYLREGRLEIVGEDGNLILECESCGKAIKTGRFCDECSRTLTQQLRSSARILESSLPSDKKRGVGLRYIKLDEDDDKKLE